MLDCQPSLLCYSSQSSLLTLSRGQKDLLSAVSRQAEPAGPASVLAPCSPGGRIQPSTPPPKANQTPHSKLGTGYFSEDLMTSSGGFTSHSTLQLYPNCCYTVCFFPQLKKLRLKGTKSRLVVAWGWAGGDRNGSDCSMAGFLLK